MRPKRKTYLSARPKPFTWRRRHVECRRTIFNLCAVFNPLEERFALFLDSAEDVLRFATLAESYTRFRVDYLSANNAIRFYYPDFVAVQTTPEGEVHWVIETKGREYEDTERKDAAMRDWCEKISAQTDEYWKYMRVAQVIFDQRKDWSSLTQLVDAFGKTDQTAQKAF